MTCFGQLNIPLLFVDVVVAIRRTFFVDIFLGFDLLIQLRDQAINIPVQLGTILNTTRDDQWRAGLINQNRVDFIDNGII